MFQELGAVELKIMGERIESTFTDEI